MFYPNAQSFQADAIPLMNHLFEAIAHSFSPSKDMSQCHLVLTRYFPNSDGTYTLVTLGIGSVMVMLFSPHSGKLTTCIKPRNYFNDDALPLSQRLSVACINVPANAILFRLTAGVWKSLPYTKQQINAYEEYSASLDTLFQALHQE